MTDHDNLGIDKRLLQWLERSFEYEDPMSGPGLFINKETKQAYVTRASLFHLPAYAIDIIITEFKARIEVEEDPAA